MEITKKKMNNEEIGMVPVQITGTGVITDYETKENMIAIFAAGKNTALGITITEAEKLAKLLAAAIEHAIELNQAKLN